VKRFERLIVPGVILLLIAIVIARSIPRAVVEHAGPAWVTLTCEHMATTISVTVPDDKRAGDAVRIVSDTFGEVDRDMSEWKAGSPLAEVNRLAGVEPVKVPPDLLDLVERSIRLAEITNGAFDPTWAALWGVWDFKAEHPRVPDDAAIERATALIDYRQIEIDRDASTLYLPRKGMKIGLGGIAKGYALDLTVQRLHDAGFNDFVITGGGQVYASGTKDGRPWCVGVRDPRGPPDDSFGIVELSDASLSTSGDYERFFIIDGVRYHHILDPRTGRPADSPRSVTVLCPDATLADAVSTALMIVEPAPPKPIPVGTAADAASTVLIAVPPDPRELLIRETGVTWALIVEQDGTVTQLGESPPGFTLLHNPRSE